MAKGIARKGFDLDLQDGLAAEGRLRDALIGAKIEVKSDRQAWKTGNIFVELHYRGNPSGFLTTEAEFWAFEVRTNRFLLISHRNLEKLINEALSKGLATLGGDKNQSEGVLIPFEWFLSH